MGSERCQPNEALRRQRLLRGWSQQKVAGLLETNEMMVGRWERGERKTSPFYQEKLCDLFGMTAEELGFMSEPQTTKKEEGLRADTDREPINEQQDASLRLTSPFISATLIEPFVTFDASLLERLSYALARPSSINDTTLNYLETRTQHYWRDRQSAVVASCDLLSYVWDHLQKITILLEGALLPSIRLRLCALASRTAQLIGELLLDMSYYTQARKFHEAAITAAQEAQHRTLEAIAWGRTSLAWTYIGDTQKALICVQAARRLTVENAHLTIQAWLAAIDAEVQAGLFHFDSCLELLDEAACVEGQHYHLDETFQVHFDHSLLRSYQGACFRQLYRPDEAQSRIFLDKAQNVLLDALAQLDPTLLQRRPKFLIDLADIYLQQREIEEACERAIQAATMASQIKLQKVIQRLLRLRQELEPWKETSSVKKLDNSLTALLVSNKHF